MINQFIGKPFSNNSPTFIGTSRAQVNHPVRFQNKSRMVLNTKQSMTLIEQSFQCIQQNSHIGNVQTGGGFIQNIKGLAQSGTR